MSEVRIIHTSDFHGALTRAKAMRLRKLKGEHQALLVDTGDAIAAPNVALFPWREPTIQRMNEAGYDAMGLGNREYFFRAGGMSWKTGHATFPRICSNLRGSWPCPGGTRGNDEDRTASGLETRPTNGSGQERRGDLAGVEPWAVVQTPQGLRVGLLALMPTMIEPGHWFEWLSNTRFRQWQEAAKAAASALADECGLVVALFHRAEEEIGELTTLCPEVDLVLLGHTHGTAGPVERCAGNASVSRIGEGARQARVIGLRTDDRSVTMDELIDLDLPDAAGAG